MVVDVIGDIFHWVGVGSRSKELLGLKKEGLVMTMPGFTAEASFYRASAYHSPQTNHYGQATNLVRPSIYIDWIEFPPWAVPWWAIPSDGGAGGGGGGRAPAAVCPSPRDRLVFDAVCHDWKTRCIYGNTSYCDDYNRCCRGDAGTPYQ